MPDASRDGDGVHPARHWHRLPVHDVEADTTSRAGCGAVLVVRDWYEIFDYRLDAGGRCPDCGRPLAGRFGSHAGGFGRRRVPVTIPSGGVVR